MDRHEKIRLIPGARGANINEKEINLAVALKLGRLIENNAEDVRVIYTRKTDRFIELDERANIANRILPAMPSIDHDRKSLLSRLKSGQEKKQRK